MTYLFALQMSEAEWRVAAARVGLPTATWPSEAVADTQMLAIGGDVIAGPGPISLLHDGGRELANRLIDLAEAVGLPLLEASFAVADGGGFVTANPRPDIGSYGELAIDAIERAGASR